MASEQQIGVETVLDGGQAQLLQPGDLRAGRLDLAQVGERGPAPERQRLPERARGPARVAARQRRTAVGGQPGEAVGVDLIRRYNQPVT